MQASLRPARIAALIVAGGIAALPWQQAFGWWARTGGYAMYKLAHNWLSLQGVIVIMATDAVFALGIAMLLAWIFLRCVRSAEYLSEAVVVPAFLAGLVGLSCMDGDGAMLFLRLPTLWLSVMAFAIIVGYGIKFRRLRISGTAR